jgi:hypothetical protein
MSVVMRFFSVALTLVLLAGNAQAPVLAQVLAQTVDTVSIAVAGTYRYRPAVRETSPSTPNGIITRGDVELIEKTNLVCARIGVGFGVEYTVEGTPDGRPTELTFITHVPSPGMLDPQGRRFDKSQFTSSVRIGEPRYRLYTFDEAWEIVPGEWVFEFLHQGRKIGETRFTVVGQCGVS